MWSTRRTFASAAGSSLVSRTAASSLGIGESTDGGTVAPATATSALETATLLAAAISVSSAGAGQRVSDWLGSPRDLLCRQKFAHDNNADRARPLA